jgi:hypothetical protein
MSLPITQQPATPFVFGEGIEEVATGSTNRINFSGGTFLYVMGDLEVPCEARSMKFLFVKRRATYHKKLYKSKFDPKVEEAVLPACMSNNGETPVEWADPIIGPDGNRVLQCIKCPHAKQDAVEVVGYKCATRQVIYIIPAEYPDRIFEWDVPPMGVFGRVDSTGKYRGLNDFVKFAQARLRNMVHPLSNSEAFPDQTINCNLNTVWSYATPFTTDGKNSVGFSLDGGTGKGEQFLSADDLREAHYVVTDPSVPEQFTRPVFKQWDKPAEVLEAPAAEPQGVPSPPTKRLTIVPDVYAEEV